MHTLLDTGALNIAVGCFDFGLERHCGVRLYEQSLACCFNPDLIDPDAPLTVDRYLALPHVLMTLKDDIQGCLSDALGRIGQELTVVLAASDFLTALATAAAVLATLPGRIAQQHARHFGLILRPIPLDLRLPAVSMVWSGLCAATVILLPGGCGILSLRYWRAISRLPIHGCNREYV